MNGLSSHEAEIRLKKFGLNVIEETKRKTLIAFFIDQLSNLLVILLIIASAISFIVGEHIDAALILAIVFLNALFGIYQEKKAGESIAALKKLTINNIRVRRDGKDIEIESKFLVPGDMVFIEEGVRIPADGKVIESINLEINESSLTGESLAVSKSISDQVFMGTIVSKGRGYLEITKTGMETKFGEIAAHLSGIEIKRTPLQIKIASLSRIIGIVGIALAALIFVLSLLQGSTYFPAFLLSVSLAVAVVPEGLPAVMTVTLAIGVKEMAKKKSIMKNLAAIEALGNITLIATDKTGTITTNKMQVKEVYVNNKVYTLEDIADTKNETLTLLTLNGILCSTASLVYVHDSKSYDVLGDPTEGSLLYLAQKFNLDYEEIRKEWKLIDEESFNSKTKIMSVQVSKKDTMYNFQKGALESIMQRSKYINEDSNITTLTAQVKKRVEDKAEEWARKGLRIIAFSYSTSDYEDSVTHAFSQSSLKTPSTVVRPSSESNGNVSMEQSNNIFLGMVAIHDPPRPEVKDAILKAEKAGIKVVMITGDNEKTAEAIGQSVGLIKDHEEILTGNQVEEYSDEELLKILPKVRIFARTTPFHKSRIVKLYQRLGEIVAVTGDGVNDAIALKQANVGIAMGLVGTDVARESADMVITDDNFATIIQAVEQGRYIVKNIQNAIKYLFATNISEALTLIVGLLIGIPYFLYPIQILYINFIGDGIPALALAFSPHEEQVMKKPPAKKLELITKNDYVYIFGVAFLSMTLIFTGYYLYKNVDTSIAKTAAFSILAIIQSFVFVDIWLSHRPLFKNIAQLRSVVFLLPFFVPMISIFIMLQIPFLASLFNIVTLPTNIFLILVLLSSTILIGIAALKRLIYR